MVVDIWACGEYDAHGSMGIRFQDLFSLAVYGINMKKTIVFDSVDF